MCAVIGVPDDHWGERVHAVIVPRPGAVLEEAGVIAHCRDLIAGYKCPRSVEFAPSCRCRPPASCRSSSCASRSGPAANAASTGTRDGFDLPSGPGPTKTSTSTATRWAASSRPRWCPATRPRATAAAVGHALWRHAGELGFLCRRHPRGMGRRGRRLPPRGGAVRGDGPPWPHRHGHVRHAIVAHYLLNHGTPDQKARCLASRRASWWAPSRRPNQARARTCRPSARAPNGAATTTCSTAARPSSRTASSPGWCWWWRRPILRRPRVARPS